jgi:O-acetyl-ADP-ribose deacetylase (regulator of RNase III)
MRIKIGAGQIELVLGDITNQQVDAVVNAANSRLAGGGGVDGAIHRHGGPEIMAETNRKYPDGCPTGSAVISGAGNLAAKHVIHVVGPVWRGGKHGEADLLASGYRKALQLAVENGSHQVAFPALSAGVYGYPLDQAGRVALETVAAFLRENGRPAVVRFVLFNQEAFDAFAAAAKVIASRGDRIAP